MRIRTLILILTASLLVIGGYFAWQTAVAADVGAAAMAKVVCSCVFVEGRSLDACRADDPPGFEGVSVSLDQTAKAATGSVLGLVRRRAIYSPTYGCTLEP